MKNVINEYYRWFCSIYAKDICSFVNDYTLDENGEFEYLLKYSGDTKSKFWKLHSRITISDIWTAIKDLFFIMSPNGDESFYTRLIIPLCENKADDKVADLALITCESFIKYVVYNYFKLPENPKDNSLTLGTTSWAFSRFCKENIDGVFTFWQAIKLLADMRNTYCHSTPQKPIEDSEIIRVSILKYIISVIVGIVAVLNKFKSRPEESKNYRIYEPLGVIIKKNAAKTIAITAVSWSQNESAQSIDKIEGAEIRDFEIEIQRHEDITFNIEYEDNGQKERETFSISLNLNDNIDFVLEICIPEAEKNCRFKKKYQTDVIIEDDLCEKQQEDQPLSVRNDIIEAGTLNISGKSLRVLCRLSDISWGTYGYILFWECEIIGVDDVGYQEDLMIGTDISELDLSKVSVLYDETFIDGIDDYKMQSLLGLSSYIEDNKFRVSIVKENAFCNQNFEEIRIPSLFFVQERGFAENINLKRLYLANDDLIGPSAFADCVNLQHIYTSPGDIIVFCRQAFKNCSSLNAIEISSKPGEEAFSGCTKLQTVKFNMEEPYNGIGEDITVLEKGVFYGCKALESIEIPNTVVKICARAFYGCASLECIRIPYRVEVIGEEAFANCSSLKEIHFENISEIKEIHTRAFMGCDIRFIYDGRKRLSITDFCKEYAHKLTEEDVFRDTPKSRRLFQILEGMFVNNISEKDCSLEE